MNRHSTATRSCSPLSFMPLPYRLLSLSNMLLLSLLSASCRCEPTCQCEIFFRALHSQLAFDSTRRHSARSPHSHAAPQRRGQASHPARVRSTLSHSQLRRSRCPPCSEGRMASAAALASAVGWQRCLAGAQGGQRQGTCTQQQAGAATRTRPHPRCQPRTPRHPLHQAAAARAGGDRQAAQPPLTAALRQGGAGSEAKKRQEEDSRGE
jgi:hypothetical protein